MAESKQKEWKKVQEEREKFQKEADQALLFFQIPFFSVIAQKFCPASVLGHWLSRKKNKKQIVILLCLGRPRRTSTLRGTITRHKFWKVPTFVFRIQGSDIADQLVDFVLLSCTPHAHLKVPTLVTWFRKCMRALTFEESGRIRLWMPSSRRGTAIYNHNHNHNHNHNSNFRLKDNW